MRGGMAERRASGRNWNDFIKIYQEMDHATKLDLDLVDGIPKRWHDRNAFEIAGWDSADHMTSLCHSTTTTSNFKVRTR